MNVRNLLLINNKLISNLNSSIEWGINKLYNYTDHLFVLSNASSPVLHTTQVTVAYLWNFRPLVWQKQNKTCTQKILICNEVSI